MLRRTAALAAALGLAVLFAPGGRPLTGTELEALRTMYGDEVCYRCVRVHAWPLPPMLTAFVAGNRIVFRRGYHLPDFSIDAYRNAQLVHEISHVLDNQRYGPLRSLAAVAEHLRFGGGVYRYGTPADHGSLAELRMEQRARFFEDWYLRGRLGEDVGAFRALAARSAVEGAGTPVGARDES